MPEKLRFDLSALLSSAPDGVLVCTAIATVPGAGVPRSARFEVGLDGNPEHARGFLPHHTLSAMNPLRFLQLTALALVLTACQPRNDAATVRPGADTSAMDPAAMDPDAMDHDTLGTSYSDVGFLDQMTMHHQMALDMAQPAAERAGSTEVRRMAQEIIRSQQVEIDSMRAWRARWFPDAPAPGPMTADDMAAMGMDVDRGALESATGAAFDRLFQQMMIPHHAGAITMAAEAQMHAERPEIRSLAQDIIAAQAEEISEMQARLGANDVP